MTKCASWKGLLMSGLLYKMLSELRHEAGALDCVL